MTDNSFDNFREIRENAVYISLTGHGPVEVSLTVTNAFT